MTTFKQSELLAKFNLVKSGASKNSTIQALKVVKVTVSDNKFTLTTGNGEMQLSASGECNGDSFNECVSLQTFGVMLSAAKNEIDIKVKDGKLNTASGKSKFSIPCTDGALYPILTLDGEVTNGNLRTMISGVYKAAPAVDVRVMLVGVCLDASAGVMSAVGTDGHVLLINQMETDRKDFQIIIPLKAAEYLSNIDTDGYLVSGNSLKSISLSNNLEIITRLIDAKYVDFKRIISDYEFKLSASIPELVDSISTISKIENVTNAHLKSSKGLMSVSTKDGSGMTVLNEIEVSGDDIDFSYSPANLLKCLNFLGNDIESISFNASGWMQAGNDSSKFFIAPMRV
jgi:DNA polymerase III sliding clamp (beta) subunit (PCNA family)